MPTDVKLYLKSPNTFTPRSLRIQPMLPDWRNVVRLTLRPPHHEPFFVGKKRTLMCQLRIRIAFLLVPRPHSPPRRSPDAMQIASTLQLPTRHRLGTNSSSRPQLLPSGLSKPTQQVRAEYSAESGTARKRSGHRRRDPEGIMHRGQSMGDTETGESCAKWARPCGSLASFAPPP